MSDEIDRQQRKTDLANAVGEVVRNVIVAVTAARDLKKPDPKPDPRAGFRR